MSIVDWAKKALGLDETDTAKRKGLYISRPVLNGKAWNDWAVKFGIPEPLGSDDLHVTVLYSFTPLSVPPRQDTLRVLLGEGGFKNLGTDGSALVFAWDDYTLWSRHSDLICLGATSAWPSFMAHMTLSMSAKGFEISDEALAAAPPSIILGPEVFDEIKDYQIDTTKAAYGAVAVEMVATQVDLVKAMETRMPVGALTAAWEAGAGRPIPTDSAKLLRDRGVLAAPARTPAAETRKGVNEAEVFKLNEEERIAWGWASVATVSGEDVIDWHDEAIAIKALKELCHDLMTSTRKGLFNHSGEQTGEIVEAMVFDDERQKALGIDMGREGLLIAYRVDSDDVWKMVKSGDCAMFSISARVVMSEGDEGAG